jgi:GntR family transcriptional regulator, vanillate catabolism transcriptional regulator
MSKALPIAQALTTRIRDMILGGEFTAGQHLREVQLADMFGASRTPVRLALASNERDGLLEYSPNRGYVVRPFDVGDITKAYEIRALIEGFAARKAAEQGLAPDRQDRAWVALRAVDALLNRSEGLDQPARELWRSHNAQFHRAIIEQSDNRFIEPILLTVQQIPSVYPPIFAGYEPSTLRRYNDQHRQVLDTILAREGTRAEFLMREHIQLASETICASIARQAASRRGPAGPNEVRGSGSPSDRMCTGLED